MERNRNRSRVSSRSRIGISARRKPCDEPHDPGRGRDRSSPAPTGLLVRNISLSASASLGSMDSNTVEVSHDAGTPSRRRGKSDDNRVSAKWTEGIVEPQDSQSQKELQAEIFEGVVATGSRAFAPSSGNLPVIDSTNSEGSGETIPEGIVEPQASIIAKKLKRLRFAESIAKSLDTIAHNGRMRVEQRAACMPANELAECINSLHALPGIAHGSKLWFYALELLMDPPYRIVYLTIPTNDLRLTWLEEKLAKDKLINPSLYPSFAPY